MPLILVKRLEEVVYHYSKGKGLFKIVFSDERRPVISIL